MCMQRVICGASSATVVCHISRNGTEVCAKHHRPEISTCSWCDGDAYRGKCQFQSVVLLRRMRSWMRSLLPWHTSSGELFSCELRSQVLRHPLCHSWAYRMNLVRFNATKSGLWKWPVLTPAGNLSDVASCSYNTKNCSTLHRLHT